MALVGELLQITWLVTALTVAVGFTNTLKVKGAAGQVMPPLVYCALNVIRPVAGPVPELTAVKEGIFPVPDAAKPMAVLLLLHE